jgi:hypothetical protein
MPTNTDLIAVARELKRQINGHAFRTVARTELTALLREASGQLATRLKRNLATGLGRALADEGVLVHPPLQDTTTGDTVRMCHAGSLFARLQKMILEPDSGSDRELGDVLRKIKGQWDWPNNAA